MMGDFGYGFGAGWMMLMPLVWLLLIGLVVWAVIRLTPGTARHEAPLGQRRESPRELLDRRLANGEINPAQYDEARSRLTREDSR